MLNALLCIPDYVSDENSFITIFGIKIYLYAICIVSGILACALLAIPLFKKRGIKPDFILDLMIGIIPCSIICARLWYVLFDIQSFHSFWDIFKIREGGMAIFGGVAGGALGIFIVCKIRKQSIVKVMDLGAAMLPLGQAIGRWGNYFNQEVYGGAVTDPNKFGLPWSVYIESEHGYFQALFFYEMCLNTLLFIGLYLFTYFYKGKRTGYGVGLYFIGYGTIRAIMEPMRDSEFNLAFFGKTLDIPAMTIIGILLALAGAAIIGVCLYKDYKEKHSAALSGGNGDGGNGENETVKNSVEDKNSDDVKK